MDLLPGIVQRIEDLGRYQHTADSHGVLTSTNRNIIEVAHANAQRTLYTV